MAAGLGFKTFTTGEVLTAADVNGYLMQGILVFATEAARNSGITSPQEGQFAFTKDTNSLWYYTGSAWVASGATGDIEGVTAGTGISGGGTSGTVTITNSMATAIDAKGDLIVGTGADTFSRLAVGTNGQVLTADSGEATGLKFATPAGGGKVLQVVQATYNTSKTIASTSYTDTDLTLSITPSSATSKVLVMVQQFIKFEKLNTSPFPTSETLGGTLKIVRGATDIYTLAAGGQGAGGFYQDLASGTQGDLRLFAQVPMIYLDSPATTSSTTYKTQGKAEGTDASGKIVCQSDSTYSSITLMEIGA